MQISTESSFVLSSFKERIKVFLVEEMMITKEIEKTIYKQDKLRD